MSENLRCVQCGARLVSERRKRGGIVDRKIGEDLSVHFDAGVFQAVDERVVIHVVLVRSRVDALNPELAEIALLVLAIAVRVLPAALDVLLRGLPQFAAGTKGATRSLHDLLLPLQTRNVGYGTRHGGSPYACSRRFMRLVSPVVAINPDWRKRRFRLEVFLVKMWLLKAL